MSTPSDIRLQVMWNRLLSVVEEQARALVLERTKPRRAKA